MTDFEDAAAILKQLIRIPSVNPMGRDVTGEPYGEQRLTEFLERFFRQLGLPCVRQPVGPQQENICVCLEGAAEAGTLAWEVHQDTVPTEGMTIAPFEPNIRQNRIYGRGACDDKGPMACMLAALARLARERPPHASTILMACTVNEENGFSGADSLARLWRTSGEPLLSRLPNAMIVAEPTLLDVVTTHKGVLRWRCHTRGVAAHSSQPNQGQNAIYHMGHLITSCENYARDLARLPPHADLGPRTLSLGTIRGGLCVNAVPDQCQVEFDRRLLPNEDPHAAWQAAVDALTAGVPDFAQKHCEHDRPFLASPGLSDALSRELTDGLLQIAHDLGAQARRAGVSYATDAPYFAQLGIPTVVFGPGSIEQAHTADEWISLDQLRAGVEAYYESAVRGLGRCGVPHRT